MAGMDLPTDCKSEFATIVVAINGIAMHCALIAAVPISITCISSALKIFIIDGAKIKIEIASKIIIIESVIRVNLNAFFTLSKRFAP